jgi:hypothetical protein
LYYYMAKDLRTVRDVDEATWRKFRAKTEEEGLKTGQALNEALTVWVRSKEKQAKNPDPNHFLKIEGIVRTKRRVRWSEEIDETLYGKGR